jgi:hypothetical protein
MAGYTYAPGPGQAPRFLPLPPPTADEVARVLAGTARRIRRGLEERAGDDEDALARDEPLLALLAAASLRTRIATGPHRGEPWRRLGDRVEPREVAEAGEDPDAASSVPQYGGMSLHADVAVPARDRRRLERLCRYVARPPLANERLEERPDGTLALRLKTRWSDGTTHILMERSELIECLVPLIPPPRVHQIRYHGILAPGASQRDHIVPGQVAARSADSTKESGDPCEVPPAEEPRGPAKAAHLAKGPSDCGAHPENSPDGGALDCSTEGSPSHVDPADRARRMRWAALLQRVFEVDALCCPRCGSTVRLIAAIEDTTVARKILECLELPARAPALVPVTAEAPDLGPDEADWLFDQSPVHDEP